VARTNYLIEAVNVEAKNLDKIPKPEPWPRPYETLRGDAGD